MGNCTSAARGIEDPYKYTGLIATFTNWQKSYNNLFDYTQQQNQYVYKTINIESSCHLIKINQEFIIDDKAITIDKSLIKLTKNTQFFIIQLPKPDLNYFNQQVWVSIKSLPTKKYRLKQQDIIKIGNKIIKIKQLVFEDHRDQSQKDIKTKFKIYQNITKENSEGYNPEQGTDQPICRVCLEEGQLDNPLITPCACSGSSKFIHIKCIRQWFNKAINPHVVNSAIILRWKPLICQLCSKNLPFKIYFDNTKYHTVNIPRPNKPYIVLNPINKRSKQISTYYLISFRNKAYLSMGRKKQADIVLEEDPSISRFHSMLSYVEEGNDINFYISDDSSKFGTLVLLKKSINLLGNFPGITLQFGGSTIRFVYKLQQYKSYYNDINHQQQHELDQKISQDINDELIDQPANVNQQPIYNE